ncbi:MAG: hypothetical protein JO193_04655 [Candidatus Eremiobacteraeota bacterium]|nr:hypothetical protein [Candidatus Eremiobacteraeota bacterium]MBV9971902.1 hypothetical protein [Candidatus Eremiobacteraeota bacterium]
MLQRSMLIGIAVASLFMAAVPTHPVSAAVIDKLTIKNDTSDSPLFYTIYKSAGVEEGCLRHRQTHSDNFLFVPKRVDIKVYSRTCRVGSAVYDKTFNYWAPHTTYTVTGSQYSHDINVSTQH